MKTLKLLNKNKMKLAPMPTSNRSRCRSSS